MSTTSRSSATVLLALMVVSVVYLLTRNEDSGAVAVANSEIPAAESSTGPKPAESKGGETSAASTGESDTHKAGHAADCAHCADAAKSSAEASPQLLTNPKADPVFKKLARMEPKVIPADTFDFLKGSQKGERVSFEVGFSGHGGAGSGESPAGAELRHQSG